MDQPGARRPGSSIRVAWLVATLALAAVLAVIIAVVLTRGDNLPTTVLMPELFGLTEDQALARLDDLDLSARLEAVASAASAGVVVAQEPGAGEAAPADGIVTLAVSSGSEAAPPAEPGPPVPEAAEGPTVTETVIIEEEPETVTVVVEPAPEVDLEPLPPTPPPEPEGANPDPVTPETDQTPIVPDVVGQDQLRAGATLEAVGLIPDTYPVPSDAPLGEVVAQDPPSGTEVARSEHVRLNVSIGREPLPEVRVPDVTGPLAPLARQRLRELGLTMITAERDAPSAEEVDEVILQEPAVDTTVPQFGQITLYVGR